MYPLLVRRRACAAWAGTLALLLVTSLAGAQTVYRNVGPDGRVTFSDQPIAGSNTSTVRTGTGASAISLANLPYELRQVASRYPVTLYSGSNCAPCDAGRSLLQARGVPFVERTIQTQADIQALQQLNSTANVPLLTIGSQRLPGYSSSDWAQYLDAAGYPATSRLPGGYRNPDPSPLAPEPPPTDPQQRQAEEQTPPPLPTNLPPPDPSGIRF